MTKRWLGWALCVMIVALSLGMRNRASAAEEPDNAPASSEEKALPIDAAVLAGIEDRAPVRNASENLFESQAYNFVLVQASKLSSEDFARSARRDVTFAHLWEQPGDYRGQVIHVEGRLKRLRQFDAPRPAAAEGVAIVYEGWIFAEEYFSNPYCVLVTQLPPGLGPAEKMERQATFDGYFFKRYRYRAGDGLREAPLLIGRTLAMRDAAPADSSPSLSQSFLLLLLAFFAGVVICVVILSLWMRRGDRQVQARLARTRLPGFLEPEQDSESGAAQ